jgi:hypothetical protein
MPIRTQIIPKSAVDSGQFPLASLRAWSIYKNIKIVVPGLVSIKNGIIKLEVGNGTATTGIQKQS